MILYMGIAIDVNNAVFSYITCTHGVALVAAAFALNKLWN